MVAFSEVKNLNFWYRCGPGFRRENLQVLLSPGEVPLKSYKFRGLDFAKAAASAAEGRI